MHLEELPSGSWRVTVTEAGARRRATAKTRGEARRLGAQLLLEMGGAPVAYATVGDSIDAFLADARYGPRTRPEIDRAVARIPAKFLDRQISEVEPVIIAGLWRELTAAGHGPHAIKRIRDVLSQTWQRAITLGWARSNPITAVPPPARAEADEVNPPDPDEVKAIIAACGGRPVGLALQLAASTGLRRGELVALRWEDVRLDTAELVVRRSLSELPGKLVEGQGKTGRGGHRVIPLGLPMVIQLRKHDRSIGARALFQFSGEPWRPSYVSREFNRSCVKAGLIETVDVDGKPQIVARYHLHALRHFTATRWLAAGVPVAQVAYLLGHASPATTLRVYAHWIPAQSRAEVEAVAALLG